MVFFIVSWPCGGFFLLFMGVGGGDTPPRPAVLHFSLWGRDAPVALRRNRLPCLRFGWAGLYAWLISDSTTTLSCAPMLGAGLGARWRAPCRPLFFMGHDVVQLFSDYYDQDDG